VRIQSAIPTLIVNPQHNQDSFPSPGGRLAFPIPSANSFIHNMVTLFYFGYRPESSKPLSGANSQKCIHEKWAGRFHRLLSGGLPSPIHHLITGKFFVFL